MLDVKITLLGKFCSKCTDFQLRATLGAYLGRGAGVVVGREEGKISHGQGFLA